MQPPIPSLLVVLAAAVVAPLVGELMRRIGPSIVALDLALGVAIGPQGPDRAAAEGAVPPIAAVGMALLFFLAGLEIELEAIRARPLRLARPAGSPACRSASRSATSVARWACSMRGSSSRSRSPPRRWACSCRCSSSPAG
jgi:hypothetical protein